VAAYYSVDVDKGLSDRDVHQVRKVAASTS